MSPCLVCLYRFTVVTLFTLLFIKSSGKLLCANKVELITKWHSPDEDYSHSDILFILHIVHIETFFKWLLEVFVWNKYSKEKVHSKDIWGNNKWGGNDENQRYKTSAISACKRANRVFVLHKDLHLLYCILSTLRAGQQAQTLTVYLFCMNLIRSLNK